MADRPQRPAWDPLSREQAPTIAADGSGVVSAPPIDREATELLAAELGQCVVRHYHRRPRGNATVLEILNAMASLSALVIKGTGADAKSARAWFDVALDQQLMGEEQGHG